MTYKYKDNTKQQFRQYARFCRRCDESYITPSKYSKICPNCDKRPDSLKTKLRG